MLHSFFQRKSIATTHTISKPISNTSSSVRYASMTSSLLGSILSTSCCTMQVNSIKLGLYNTFIYVTFKTLIFHKKSRICLLFPLYINLSFIIMPVGLERVQVGEVMKKNQMFIDIGGAIKEGIVLNNMTQKEVAKAIHVSPQTMSCFILNHRTPHIYDLVAIVQLLHLDIRIVLDLKKDNASQLDHIIYQKVIKLNNKHKEMINEYAEQLLKQEQTHYGAT